MICTVLGCGNDVYGRQKVCKKHYDQLRRCGKIRKRTRNSLNEWEKTLDGYLFSLYKNGEEKRPEKFLVDEESFEKPKPGLGAHLYEKLGRKNLNIIGIAKSYYRDNNLHTFQCFRGNSKNPLYVDSINQDKDYSEVIKSMYGNFRIPYLIKLADTESKINFK